MTELKSIGSGVRQIFLNCTLTVATCGTAVWFNFFYELASQRVLTLGLAGGTE